MQAQMQDSPLLVSQLIEHAARVFPDQTIVTRTVQGERHEYTYRDALKRSKQLAMALQQLGVRRGDVVATLAWNTYRHFECWYGISGMGAVLHTINPRLFAEQITYIVNHAQDSYIVTDVTFVPLLEALAPHLDCVKGYIVLCSEEQMPASKLPNALCYESLLAAQSGEYNWPEFDDSSACSLCYTSGTTGHPKGVLYSHRSSVLHSFAVCARSGMGLDTSESVLPIVPMFHANAWGLVYACAMAGAKVVLPGPHLDGASICALINAEQVDFTAAVPTVWTMLLAYLESSGERIDSLKSVIIGGSAVPAAMIEKFELKYGVEVWQAWGMTELSPLGTINKPLKQHLSLPYAEQLAIKVKQGRPVFGVEMKIVGPDNRVLPHDGKSFGRLLVRGPWVVSRYFRMEESATDCDGWFDTGDVATIDAQGIMQITDRSKDVIKSGGEWISSIDLENAAVGHADVHEAAVIGMYHPKWDERPLLIVVPRHPDKPFNKNALMQHLEARVAKWWLPDAIELVTEIPHTATGKINKVALREQFAERIKGQLVES